MKTVASSVTVFGLAMSLGMLGIACGGADESEDGFDQEREAQTYVESPHARRDVHGTSATRSPSSGQVAAHPLGIPSPGPQIAPAAEAVAGDDEVVLGEDEAGPGIEAPSER